MNSKIAPLELNNREKFSKVLLKNTLQNEFTQSANVKNTPFTIKRLTIYFDFWAFAQTLIIAIHFHHTSFSVLTRVLWHSIDSLNRFTHRRANNSLIFTMHQQTYRATPPCLDQTEWYSGIQSINSKCETWILSKIRQKKTMDCLNIQIDKIFESKVFQQHIELRENQSLISLDGEHFNIYCPLNYSHHLSICLLFFIYQRLFVCRRLWLLIKVTVQNFRYIFCMQTIQSRNGEVNWPIFNKLKAFKDQFQFGFDKKNYTEIGQFCENVSVLSLNIH